jgi:5-formyltetrahydrofolate cyclo-ligase
VAKKKEYLRKKFAGIRNSLPDSYRKQKSLLAGEKLSRLEEFRKSETVMFFISFRSEVNTVPMIKKALKLKKHVVLPKVFKKSLKAVEISNIRTDLCPGAYNILEPVNKSNTVEPQRIDLVLVPGLVFDKFGYRIGYGGGYYDRWLKHIKPGRRIGLAFDFQVLSRIPHARTDVAVSKIVTEKRIITM